MAREVAPRSGKPLFLRTLDGEIGSRQPIWLMRQAGRYLPEYREIRATGGSFLEFCYTPRLATEATLQPIRRFGFDAAILFSDILVVPDALGQRVDFVVGEGPRLEPIAHAGDLARLSETIDLAQLAPVFETIDRLKGALSADTPLIGFCGAPWTLASYMIAGQGTPDQAPARLFAYRHPDAMAELISRLTRASIAYLLAQAEAGVDCLQVFDTWAGVLPPGAFERWSLEPLKAIVAGVKARFPDLPIIVFARGVGPRLGACTALGADALGLDTAIDPAWAAATLPVGTVLQGNLDPLALVAGGAALDAAVSRIRDAFRGRPHVFNLGHGILPETPIAHVERLLDLVRTEASV